MLILKEINEKSTSKEIKVSVLGQDITLKVRPLGDSITDKLRKRYKRDEDFADALIDHILEDFDGVGDQDGNPLPVNVANKKRVMAIPSMDGNPSVSEVVFDTAKKLAYEIAEAELKNS